MKLFFFDAVSFFTKSICVYIKKNRVLVASLIVLVETSGFGQREGDRGLRPPGVALGRRLGIGTVGERVGSWHEKLGFH